MTRLPVALLVVASCCGVACHAPAAAPVPAGEAGTLAWMLGRWSGTRTEVATGDAAPLTVNVRTILGEPNQLEELEVRLPNTIYRAVHLRVFRPDQERWMGTYVNRVHGEPVALECARDGERSTWLSSSRRSRLLYERPGPGGWRRTQEVSEDGGVTWRVLFVDELRRERDTR